ncbi:MAG TPA: TrbG/VirB9 family P-type conjugative transfer protein [Allosphingosinicella sp.]
MRPLAVLLAAALLAAPALAQRRPQPGPGDPRIQTVDYAADQVVVLEAAPGYQLTVELAPDEQIENVAVGDSGAWQVTANRRGDRLFIKPLQAGVTTNMTVITNARLYAIDLVPLHGPSPEMAYTVRFRYPEPGEEQTAAAEAAEAERPVQGRYRLSGDRRLRPSRIGDDGRQTFIEWPRDASIPAVYGLDAEGKETIVNGMMRDDVFVIDSVIQRLVFRIDRRSARAVRARNRQPATPAPAAAETASR